MRSHCFLSAYSCPSSFFRGCAASYYFLLLTDYPELIFRLWNCLNRDSLGGDLPVLVSRVIAVHLGTSKALLGASSETSHAVPETDTVRGPRLGSSDLRGQVIARLVQKIVKSSLNQGSVDQRHQTVRENVIAFVPAGWVGALIHRFGMPYSYFWMASANRSYDNRWWTSSRSVASWVLLPHSDSY